MLEVCLGLIKGDDGELLCHFTMTKTSDLRKNEPDPVTSLSPGSKFIEDCVVDGSLGGEEAVEIVCGAHKLSEAKYIPFRTISCRAMLDCKAGHSLSAGTSLFPGRIPSV